MSSKSARARGRAYRLQVGFPVFVENGLDLVPGSLLDLKNNSLLINILDEFHGVSFDEPQKSLYFRKQVEVEVRRANSNRMVLHFESSQASENGDAYRRW